MKKRFVYFLIGALLTGLVLVVFQISRAEVVAPNPGHALSCYTVSVTNSPTATASCSTGTRTGGGCAWVGNTPHDAGPGANESWYCQTLGSGQVIARVVCCKAI